MGECSAAPRQRQQQQQRRAHGTAQARWETSGGGRVLDVVAACTELDQLESRARAPAEPVPDRTLTVVDSGVPTSRLRRSLPDAITLARLPISAAIVLAPRRPRVVRALFVAGVLTDVVDGPLARRLGTVSRRGARLDTAADASFTVASAMAAVATVPQPMRRRVTDATVAVVAIRTVTLLVTRRRFGTWSVMHTVLNKASGAALACVVTAALTRRRMPIGALAVSAALATIAALEELVIVATAASYDPDRSSLFGD